MALQLSEAVIRGAIDNRIRNSVQGKIWLYGCARPLRLDLTGNCARDLIGRSFYFERIGTLHTQQRRAAVRTIDYSRLAAHHVGPVGTMSAVGNVQLAGCSPEELIEFAEQGVPVPLRWKQGLYLEWYSQHGRVVVELLDTEITFIDHDEDEDRTSLWFPMSEAPAGLMEQDASSDESDARSQSDDPYGLFPHDLDQLVEAELVDGSDDDDPFAPNELDSLVETDLEEIPLQVIFDPPLRLAPGSLLTDHQVDESLQLLLARLARHGVALTMCPHYSPREAYRLLLERILPEESVPAELVQTGYIQHFTTHVYCPYCLAHLASEAAEQDLPLDEDECG